MATVGRRLRSLTVTAAIVLVTASGLATSAAHAATTDPTSTAQPSPTPPTITATQTTSGSQLTLSRASARPGDSAGVSFDHWDFKSCALDFQQVQQPCTVQNGVLSGTVTVPSDTRPNPAVPITACPTECNGDNTIATGSLTIAAPAAATQPTRRHAGGAVAVKPPPHHTTTTTSASGHSTALIGGGAIVLVLASVGLLMLRRRPPTTGLPPDIDLVPRPDPGVVTVDPAAAKDLHAGVTIRLRPDSGRCRVEAMQR
jgi:uncharacterized Zn-binding protein involved in type VI secretion